MKILIFSGMGMITACGNQANDDRIVLSSEYEEPYIAKELVIPAGDYKNAHIDATKLGEIIAKQLDSISHVYVDSFQQKFIGTISRVTFRISLSLKLSPELLYLDAKYYEMNCLGYAYKTQGEYLIGNDYVVPKGKFEIYKCENNEAKIDKHLSIEISDILLHL